MGWRDHVRKERRRAELDTARRVDAARAEILQREQATADRKAHAAVCLRRAELWRDMFSPLDPAWREPEPWQPTDDTGESR